VQKAGTTALANFLNQHPAVYVVDGKEAHVFDHPDLLNQDNPAEFIQNKYKSKLSQLKQQRVICDATPITIYQAHFLKACYQYNPEAKFILVLRDPVQRAISHFNMSRARKQETRSMLMAFLLEPFRLAKLKGTKSWPFDSPFRNHSYLSRGCYTQQLHSLFKLVPCRQILVLQQEELKFNHAQTMHQVCLFLDIHKHPTPAKTVFKTQKSTPHWTDKLANLYARFYYFLRAESPKNWQKIIDKYTDYNK
jgi:adenylate kinase family enzyme